MSLLAAAEPNIYGELQIPPDLPEPRFSSVDSGLYGELRDDSGEPVWKSQSALGLDLPYGERPQSGQHRFSRLTLDDGTPLMALSLSVEWELANGELRPYTFSVAESLDSFHAQLARFRGQLFGWFAAVAIIMLVYVPLLTLEGASAAAVDGTMRPQERRRVIEDFRSGKTQVLVNCDLLTQGFDAPKVRALYIARPTFSPNRYHQMIGRGLRGPKNGGKERCLIVNVADTFEEFGEQLAFTEFNYLWETQNA